MVAAAATALALSGLAMAGADGLRSVVTSPAGPERATGDKRMDDLVLAIARGRDRAAFAALFAFFAPRLKAYMIRGGADADTAEELAQEAMIQVWRRAGTFDPARAGASTWIYTIARNKRIDRLRREKHPEVSEDEYADAFGEADRVQADRADAVLERGQIENRLVRSLDQLPEDQAVVVRMAFYEDKSHSAIAAELRLPLGTVKSRIRLALARLRGLVQDQDQ